MARNEQNWFIRMITIFILIIKVCQSSSNRQQHAEYFFFLKAAYVLRICTRTPPTRLAIRWSWNSWRRFKWTHRYVINHLPNHCASPHTVVSVQSGRCQEDSPQADVKDTNPLTKKHPLPHLSAVADLPNHPHLKLPLPPLLLEANQLLLGLINLYNLLL